jgi:hypothetical protein
MMMPVVVLSLRGEYAKIRSLLIRLLPLRQHNGCFQPITIPTSCLLPMHAHVYVTIAKQEPYNPRGSHVSTTTATSATFRVSINPLNSVVVSLLDRPLLIVVANLTLPINTFTQNGK